jgi:hypothetical protein
MAESPQTFLQENTGKFTDSGRIVNESTGFVDYSGS